MKNINLGLLILRVALGALFLMHGLAKLQHGVGKIGEMVTSAGLPSFFAYGVYLGEVIAPLMLIVGFRTRLAALLIAFTMVVAVALVHTADLAKVTPTGAWGVEVPALYFFGALALFFTGAGKYAASTRSKWD